jgi:LPS export ABC transporter protein LptC
LAFLAMISLAGVAAWGEEAQQGSAKKNSGDASMDSNPLIMRGLHLEEFGVDGKEFDLWAQTAQFAADANRLFLQDVRIVGSPKEAGTSRKFEMRGDRGTYDVSRQTAVIEGNVNVISQDGYVLSTEMVNYDYRTRAIDGPGVVRVEGPEGSTRAVGLHVEMTDETMVLQEDVQTVIQPSGVKRAKEVLR